MVHRKARNEMAAALRAYMEEKTTAFQFDDALTQIADATDDETVRRIGDVLWLYYDDIKDHQVVASKTDWGFFNRALLLLESEAEMDVSTTWRWHASQGVAAAGLAAWAYLAVHTGLGEHLLYLSCPFAALSMVLESLNSRRRADIAAKAEGVLAPFPSLRSLLTLRRRVPGFARIKYPKAIAGRRIRSPIQEKLTWVPSMAVWIVLSPAVLLFQMLPEWNVKTVITMPGPEVAHAPSLTCP